jgi:shikimate 5-dehydrogenase
LIKIKENALVDKTQLTPKTVPTFYFIGVTTTRSSIIQIFPKWMRVLGHPDIQLEGIDLRIHDEPQNYRQVVEFIKNDPLSVGGLVTTHKIDLLEAAKDLFDDLDPYAQLCGEISSISKLNGRLQGHARDPISVGLSMEAILGEGYFGKMDGEVLMFGAGGSATAALVHLLTRPELADRPTKVSLVDRLRGRLPEIHRLAEKLPVSVPVKTFCHASPEQNDSLMADLPEGSLVINATGMGKDIPGSPITDQGLFPYHGIAWEFNYRGELDFLRQAVAQQDRRQLRVEDGWLYFLHGWTQVIAQVLHLDLIPETFDMLCQEAETFRTDH